MSLHKIPVGSQSPNLINAVIEIPKASQNKYEYDENWDEIRLDRVLHSSVVYPCEYGFIPQTRSEDGDHLDILVICSTSTFPGCVLSVRPIGAIDMEDEAGQDWKIIAVPEKDPRMNEIVSISDLGEHFKKEVQHFFEEYKKLEGKWVTIKEWLGSDDAKRLIQEGAARFKQEG